MGMTPREVDQMTLWEFAACREGWIKANGGEQEADAPSYAEHLEMVAKLTG